MMKKQALMSENSRESRNRTFYKSLAGIILVILIIGIFFIIKHYTKSSFNTEIKIIPVRSYESEKICRTDKCLEIRNKIRRSIDFRVNPCDDFYQFACGNWKKNYIVESGEMDEFNLLQKEIYKKLRSILENSDLSSLPHAAQQTVTIYKSCININTTILEKNELKELKILLKELGGWPIGSFHYNKNNYNLMHGIANGIKKAAVMPLIRFSVAPDDSNSSQNLITLDQAELPSINLTSKELFAVIFVIAERLGGNEREIIDDYIEMIKLQNLIASTIQNSTSNSSTTIKTMLIKELDTLFPNINIIDFLQSVTNDSLKNIDYYITADDKIAIKNMGYMTEILTSIKKTKVSKRTIANYIGTNLILQYPMLAISAFVDMNKKFNHEILKYASEENVWISCINKVANFLTFATDYLYVQEIYNGKINISLRKKQKKMMLYLRQAFENLVKESQWIDDETLSAITEKLYSMTDLIGFPVWILDSKQLDDFYHLMPDMTESFSINIMYLAQFTINKHILSLGKINDIKSWPDFIPSTTYVNAMYFLQRNSIYFPLGIQNPPFFDSDAPWYLNFGAIGAIIGHEITHGFDIDGSKRDARGNIKNWWSKKSEDEYIKLTNCFIQKFNNYSVPYLNVKVNGSKTLAENMADGGGIRQAFLAYKKWENRYGKEPRLFLEFSPYQMLFISYSQIWCSKSSNNISYASHAPNKYRTLGSLSDSTDFAEAFKCPVGSPMNPVKKCVIW